MRHRVRLTESELHKIIKESVKRILKEHETDKWDDEIKCEKCGFIFNPKKHYYFDHDKAEYRPVCPRCGWGCDDTGQNNELDYSLRYYR